MLVPERRHQCLLATLFSASPRCRGVGGVHNRRGPATAIPLVWARRGRPGAHHGGAHRDEAEDRPDAICRDLSAPSLFPPRRARGDHRRLS